MAKELRAEGIDPNPRVETEGEAFTIRRLVLVRDDESGTPPRYRLVRIYERVQRDGRYEAEVRETVSTRADIERWIWKPL